MTVNIKDFGAVADGKTLCTDAFAKAIDVCAAQGGYVDIPAGEYVSGTIFLKSNVYLRFEPGAVILADKYIENFKTTVRGCSWGSTPGALRNGKYEEGREERNSKNPCPSLIIAENEENCGLTGPGRVNGRRGGLYKGTENWENAGNIFLCVFANCKNVSIKDVTFENPGFFNVYTLNCTGVFYDGVKIYSRKCPCGDGLDFDGSKNVRISNCFIDAGDDAIGLKTLTPSEPCENFTITNCVLSSVWAAVRIGPETGSDFRNINISNCVFSKCNDGFKIQLCEDRIFEDFVFSNISMVNVMRPIFMTLNTYVMCMHNRSVRPAAGKMRRIKFENISARQIQKKEENDEGQLSGNFIYAMTGSQIEDVTLSDIHFTADGGVDDDDCRGCVRPELLADYTVKYPEALMNMGNYPSAVLYIKNAKNITVKNCRFECIEKDSRPAIAADNAVNFRITDSDAVNTCGLLKTVCCSDVLARDNGGKIFGASEEEILLERKYKSEAEKLLASYAKYASAADKALFLDKEGEFFTDKECGISLEGKNSVYAVVPKTESVFTLKVNGKEAGKFDIADSGCPTCFAADITPFTVNGENVIRFEDENGEIITEKALFSVFAK